MIVCGNDVYYIPRVTYKQTDYQLISCSTGHCLLIELDTDNLRYEQVPYGQYLISNDEMLALKIKQGLRTKEYVSELIGTETFDHLKDKAIVVFNIYTLDVSFIDKRKLFGFANVKGEFNISYIGYTYPPHVALLIEDAERVVNVPDITLPKIRFGVKEELQFINLSLLKDAEEVQESYDLAKALIRAKVQ